MRGLLPSRKEMCIRDSHYGTLAEGAAGDVTICKLVRAAPVYLDNCQQEMTGTQLLIPVMTVLNGKIVYRYGEF